MEGEHAKMWQIVWKVNMPTCRKSHAKWKVDMPKCGKYHTKWKVNMPTCSKSHAKWKVNMPKMTNSSSKPLQTLGKWYQPRNPKKNPKPALKKDPKTISHPFEFFKVKLGMPPFFNNQRLERITYIEICYLKQDVGSAMLGSAQSSFYRSAKKNPR